MKNDLRKMSHINNMWSSSERTDPNTNKNCCGCSACEQVCSKSAIKMRADKEMFLYPVVDEDKCIDCSLCAKTCPVTNECKSDAPETGRIKIYPSAKG